MEQYPGTDVAHWAGVLAGDVYLGEGCRQLFRNKASAIQELRKAIEHYRTVQEQSRAPELLQRTAFGSARAYEALAGTRESGEALKRAIKAYQEVVQKWPKGAYAAVAARRLEDLKRPDIQAFYDKFAKHDPQPPVSDQTGIPGEPLPFESESLSEDGSFSDYAGLREALDELEGEDTTPKGDSSSPSEPGQTTPDDPQGASTPDPAAEESSATDQ